MTPANAFTEKSKKCYFKEFIELRGRTLECYHKGTFIKVVGCRGVVQLGGPDHWYNQVGPVKVGARKSFLFTESSGVVKIKKHLVYYLI